tara:strand:+ start:296 stop:433 length:138 start_codon:yes stop_codon:yes gene_type:complete
MTVAVILVDFIKYKPEHDIHPSRKEHPAMIRLTTKSIVSPNEITT